MQTFEVGKTYTGQSPDGYVCKTTVASRTAKTITTTAGARLLIDTRLGNTSRSRIAATGQGRSPPSRASAVRNERGQGWGGGVSNL